MHARSSCFLNIFTIVTRKFVRTISEKLHKTVQPSQNVEALSLQEIAYVFTKELSKYRVQSSSNVFNILFIQLIWGYWGN